MTIRRLKYSDIDSMIEWMKDEEINCNFKANFSNFCIEDVRNFINDSYTIENKHYAIINDNDEYLGTISLKNINFTDRNAEYAIVLRKLALGMGVAKEATEEILNMAFNELKLHKIYLNVASDNIRAIKFYEKMNFIYEGEFKEHYFICGKLKNIKWYSVFNNNEES